MKKFLSVSVIVIFSLMGGILFGGCSDNTNSEPNSPGDSFSAQYQVGQNHLIVLSGNSTGHQTGKTSQFILTLNNDDSQETWAGEYFLYLVDDSSIIDEIHSANFSIYESSERSWYIETNFAGTENSSYGLSLILPGRMEAVQTIWIGPKTNENIPEWYQVNLNSNESTGLNSEEIAENFLTTSPTYTFDGIPETLATQVTPSPDQNNVWHFIFTFQSRQAGYGDRNGEFLAQVVTHHEAVITVENGKVTSAVMDGVWDVLRQEMLSASETDKVTESSDEQQIAENFVLNSPTFKYDGIQGSLKLTGGSGFGIKTVSENTSMTSQTQGFEYTFTFNCSSAGYGDRSGQMTAQIITSHQAVITIENGVIVKAVLDGVWNMLTQTEL